MYEIKNNDKYSLGISMGRYNGKVTYLPRIVMLMCYQLMSTIALNMTRWLIARGYSVCLQVTVLLVGMSNLQLHVKLAMSKPTFIQFPVYRPLCHRIAFAFPVRFV